MGILLRVSGPRACFARPELKVEAVSYEVITPTAAKAILGAIYRKPEMEWVVDGILVVKNSKTGTFMTNGITDKITFKSALNGKARPILVNEKRDQRNMTILRDVDYVIKAHFDIVSGEKNPAKHMDMFMRRANNGQYYRCPYFGRREFSVEKFYPVDELPKSEIKGKKELGYILHSINYETNQPAFFNAVLVDGYMKIPAANNSEVRR